MTRLGIGVYRGAAVSIAPVRAYENFLGMPSGTTVGYVLAFMADSPSWSQFERAILARHHGPPGTASATAWAPLLGGRQLMLAVPACCQGTTWRQEASGVNDAHWTALAKTLVHGGLGGCWLDRTRVQRRLVPLVREHQQLLGTTTRTTSPGMRTWSA